MSIDSKKRELLQQAGFVRVLAEMVSCNAGEEVVFIYDEGAAGTPCHAVVKDVSGPWSRNRTGLCGVTPCIGPVPWCVNPDGGLCHLCAQDIEKKDGKWYLR